MNITVFKTAAALVFLTACPLTSQSPFIVTAPGTDQPYSRNEVKETIGSRLQDLVFISARLQSKVGKIMMQFAALQTTIAEQASALVEDEPPFNTSSTDKLAAAEKKMGQHVAELETLLARVDEVAQQVQKTVRLE